MYTYNINPTTHEQSFEKYSTLFVTLRGVFLAIILFCVNFLSPYIGCNYQYIMKKSPYVRYLVLFLVIYFSVNLVDTDLETIENPIHAIVRSVFVFFIFILLNNIPITTILTIMIFFACLVLTSKYYSYFKKSILHNEEHQVVIMDLLQILQWILVISIIILLIISLIFNKKSNNSLFLKKCNFTKKV